MVINTETNLNRSKSTSELHNNSYNDGHDNFTNENRANSESSLEWELDEDEIDRPRVDVDTPFGNVMAEFENSFRSLMQKLDNMSTTEYNVSVIFSVERSENQPEGSNEPSHRLLDAIAAQQLSSEIDRAITELLQSDEFKERVVSTTVDSLRSVIRSSIEQTFPETYRPVLNSFHAKVVRQAKRTLHNAFRELDKSSEYYCQSVQETTLSITRAVEKHQNPIKNTTDYGKSLQDTLEEILNKELMEWRRNLWDLLTPQMLPKPEFSERPETPEEDMPASPSQPADPSKSIVEQLLKSAMINKLISEGKVNESFEQALSACDLSLVVAACRAAGPALAPRLQQHTLLSLVQQLATDMLHETQLKCRYLEEALINLDTTDPTTRFHLPLVVGEVRKHLSNFLKTYPGHVAGRRISLIILAAENLLK
ncbi:enhancer of mRNA-decapping protein 4-like [Zerene cesonia]|uniref:enhancer of mRNA-decapping protein 4-like n=1 Tax=Zerene cesonia TaxID=33412 RepID=UPI0018E54E45|nr:enhancer of mRNA-decapping protein 4-like [Zerene cesonia]